MTKFEEEFKALTSWDWVNVDLIQKILTRFRNWHSDEEFQELFDKYSNLNDNYEKEVIKSSKLETSNLKLIAEGTGLLSDNAMLTKKVEDLKSQLQQQALPVVPECVDIWIKKCQELNWMITDVLAPESWSSDFAKDTENWLKKSKENFNLLALAFITGKYEVEKPQLFYLKNKLTGAYLYYDEATKLYSDIVGNVEDFFGTKTKFTEAEIDSMQTGSYELVPVEDGE